MVGEEIVRSNKMTRGSVPFKNTRTREEVNMERSRAVVSVDLPMIFFDNKLILDKKINCVLKSVEKGVCVTVRHSMTERVMYPPTLTLTLTLTLSA